MTDVQERLRPAAPAAKAVELVDCDVHPVITAPQLQQRLPERWRRHLERYGRRMPLLGEIYPRAANGGMRADAWPEGPHAFPGSDPVLARRQLLDEYGVDYAVLNSADLMMCYEQPEFAGALARAMNDWLQEEWLDFDSRFLGAILLPSNNPEIAVQEIERCGGDERWTQVLLPTSTEEPLGSRKYWPIYEAAVAHDLPVAVHLGGYDPHRGTGWPSFYIEEHVGYALAMESQLLNMVCDGVFEVFPELKVVLTECGVTWIVALGWALDEVWQLTRADFPHLERKPSEVIHDHVWFTTQPIDEPDEPAYLAQMIEQGRLADRLLFSTDYPHWDFGSPTQALPRTLPADLRRKIFAGNACALHGLPLRRDAA